jgi:hypothetical protein
MFVVTEAEAAAIRAAFEQRGELSAAVELRRLFPAITDTAQARACARTIAGWKPLPVPPSSVTRLRPRRRLFAFNALEAQMDAVQSAMAARLRVPT